MSSEAPVLRGPVVHFELEQKKMWLGGTIENQDEAHELIAVVTALTPMLKVKACTAHDEDDRREATEKPKGK